MIFLDTSYFVSLMDKMDVYHKNSMEIQDYLNDSNEKTVINTTVPVETLNRFIKTNILARKMFDALKAQHKIIMLTNADYIESLDVNMWFGNSINFSDCTIINTMIKRDIQDIVTFDRDFEKVDGLHVINSI